MELNNVKETVDVIVAGAGPTGLTLAVDLARRGVTALVLERGDALFPGSRGKGLQPRTLEVWHDLGTIDEVVAAGGPAPVGMVWQSGVRQGEHRMFDAHEPTETEPYSGPWLLPQWRTQEILAARLRELGGRIVLGAEVTEVRQDAEAVTVRVGEGASVRTVRARFLVAADGGRSTVRRALGVAMTGEGGLPGPNGAGGSGAVDPAPMLVADVRIAPTALDRDNWHVFPQPDAQDFVSACPLPGTPDFQVVARCGADTQLDVSPEGVRKLIADRTHLTADDVTEVRWSSEFRPRAALADAFRVGRVFLAGDAAHVHSPAGGQGLNTSVQDAYNLGWKLGAVLRHGAPEALLDSYEEERRPIAAQMLGLSTRIHRGEARRGAATRQLGLGYRDSSLSVDTRADLPDGALHAGDRAPDGRPGGIRLFDVFRGPHWTLLAVGTDAEPPPLPAEVRVHRVPTYAPYGTGLFLVRPDGYVGWAGGTPEGLGAYLARVGAGRC
ncbi:FAD-dependent monooxygenase [Streptomyces sp. NPDC002004]